MSRSLGQQMAYWAQYWAQHGQPEASRLCAELSDLWTPAWRQFLPWNIIRGEAKRRELDRVLAQIMQH